jgi:putative transposase
MTKDHRRPGMQLAQGALLNNPGFLREIVERVLQELLEAEKMTEHIGAAPYERAEGRTGHRNGHKPRTLRTRIGTLNLLVPQDREGSFSPRLFARYQRNEKALILALMEMYVEGVSTRKVKEVTEVLCGISFSKSLVSQLAGGLDSELERWRNRPLEAKAYPYLFVDARYEKVRAEQRVVSQGVLLVSGVREDGFREILGVEVADTESEATYQELFRSLKARGLSGVELVVSDEHGGLKAAVERHFQGARPPEVPGPLPEQSPRDGGSRQAQGARGGSAGGVRRHRPGIGARDRVLGGREVAPKGLPEDGRERRGARGGVPLLFGLPRAPSPTHPHDQRPRAPQPGDKAPNAGGADLPEPAGVLETRDGALRRAVGGVGDGQALPRHARARRTALARAGSRGGGTHGALGEESGLEEITETSGLDPKGV